MFLAYVLEKVNFTSEDATSCETTIVFTKLTDSKDLFFAASLVMVIKGNSGVNIVARRTAKFNRVSKASFSISSFLIFLVNLLFANFA